MQFIVTSVSFLLTRAAKRGGFGIWFFWHVHGRGGFHLRLLDSSSLAAISVDDSRENRSMFAEVHDCGASAWVEDE